MGNIITNSLEKLLPSWVPSNEQGIVKIVRTSIAELLNEYTSRELDEIDKLDSVWEKAKGAYNTLKKRIKELHPDEDFELYEETSRINTLALQILDYGKWWINGSLQKMMHNLLMLRNQSLQIQLIDTENDERKMQWRPAFLSADFAELKRDFTYSS